MKIYTCFLALIMCAFFANMQFASAVKYTTRDKPSQKKSAPIAGQKNKPKEVHKTKECSDQDRQDIKRFNVTAKKKMQEFDEFMAAKDTVKTPKQATKFSKTYKEFTEFYQSDVFKALSVVYTRCGKKIPVSQTDQLFWIYGSENKKLDMF